MIKKVLTLVVAFAFSFTFISCSNDPTTTATTEPIDTALMVDNETVYQAPTVDSGYLVDSVQDGVILHAWNWSMETVEANLEDIAIAGYSTVQISPMQPQKDYTGVASWGSTWWKFYQPLGFSIATENHALGTKDDLISLCTAADVYGIKIIVDVVANHLAGGTNESLNEDVLDYESEIYNLSLIHTGVGSISDYNLAALVRGYMGDFPDLQTENQVVQNAVLDLLKEYVDCGVDGFRFDAAKHIETPEDGNYASDFWPTVINGINNYADLLGRDDLYFYGEILNTVGSGREYTDYTTYMSVTDSSMSSAILTAVRTDDVTRLDTANYISSITASDIVLWAESHDTYASNSTSSASNEDIAKAYAVEASRKDATTLFFARPDDASFIGECGTYFWQSEVITEVNRFHNYFVGTDEFIGMGNNFFINERYDSDIAGAVIVDFDGAGTVSNLTATNMPAGAYLDQVSGNIFVVSETGDISGTVGETGVAVIYNNNYQPLPSVSVSNDGSHGSFSSTLEIEVYSHNTTEAYYSINGGDLIAFEGNIDLELSHPDLNATVTLDFELYYNDYKIERHFEYEKSNFIIEEVVVNNLNVSVVEGYKIVAWAWSGSSEGEWVEGTYSNGTFTFDWTQGDTHFLLVTFPSGTTSYDWDDKVKQTNDCEVPSSGIYDGSQFVWS